MKNIRTKSKIWEYLNALGVLERGNEEEIKDAKKAYRKNYFLNYRKRQRQNKPEFIVSLSKNKGDYSRISVAAKNHKMSITTFLRCAALAYVNKIYIIPDRLQLAELEQLLASCLNEIQQIVRRKEKYHWEREQKFEAIEKRIEKLEHEITKTLKQPPTIEEWIIKEFKDKSELCDQLLCLLNNSQNDCQNKTTS
jgi:hypothetical protein